METGRLSLSRERHRVYITFNSKWTTVFLIDCWVIYSVSRRSDDPRNPAQRPVPDATFEKSCCCSTNTAAVRHDAIDMRISNLSVDRHIFQPCWVSNPSCSSATPAAAAAVAATVLSQGGKLTSVAKLADPCLLASVSRQKMVDPADAAVETPISR